MFLLALSYKQWGRINRISITSKKTLMHVLAKFRSGGGAFNLLYAFAMFHWPLGAESDNG